MSEEKLIELAPWGALLLGLLVVLAVIVWVVRRRVLGSPKRGEPAGWSLDELKRMHDEGLLSDHEYQRLRRISIATYTQD